MFSPPHSSEMTSCFESSVRTRSGSASLLSILFTATTIGTPAARACWMASIVCGMTPSSAATTSTTTSVALAARAHGGKGRMARGVEERDDPARGLHVIGADVLRDAARLARRHFGAADVVEERGLAVIDVAHDGDHRRTRLELRFRLRALQIRLDLVLLEDLRRVAHLLDHEHRGVLIDRLIDGCHDAHVHEHLDDLGRLDRHLLRELGDRDRLADAHLTHHGRGRHLEAMLSIGRGRHGARLGAALLLVARADIGGDVQLLPAVAGVLVIGGGGGGRGGRHPLAWRGGCGSTGRALTLALAGAALVLFPLGAAARLIIASPLLGDTASLLLRAAAGLLFLHPAAV